MSNPIWCCDWNQSQENDKDGNLSPCMIIVTKTCYLCQISRGIVTRKCSFFFVFSGVMTAMSYILNFTWHYDYQIIFH